MSWSRLPQKRRVVRLFVLVGSLCGMARGEPSQPLRVRAQLSRAPYYVRQSITLQVSVIAQGERPTVIPPKIVDADVTPLGTDLKQVSSSGIGSLVFERNQFISRYRVVPRRAGVLKIPAISVRLGDRMGKSEPISVPIENVPQSGRPDSFLGGVGPFEVTAEVSPSSIPIGQVLDFRIRVTGPAALGMTQPPAIGRHPELSPGLRIEPEPVEAVAEPPSRVFRYRLRPTRAGQLVIPPVAITAFDPTLRRYMTKVSPSVAVRVVDVRRFDPSTLKYVPMPLSDTTWPRNFVAATVGGLVLITSVGTWLGLRRSNRLRRSRHAAFRHLAQLLRDLDGSLTASETGRRLTEGLGEYLFVACSRPRGVLTPGEARQGIASATGSDELGSRAERLIAHCDQAQYAIEGPSTTALLEEAKRLFDALGQTRGGAEGGNGAESRVFEKPREAAETANP
ncbi:BatD family protein [Singulisphaera sp. GP187]|uniref:BatD family protein n=1 Tax=Singulisphaera sp. GP187 TaxID=1882752 RepID=UPI0020B1663A|nr:BatD family protein [Singulisphaera sp. GP187]